MPGVEVQEGHEEVEADGGGGGDGEVGEDVSAEADVRAGLEVDGDNVHGAEGVVDHYDREDYQGGHEHFLGTGRCMLG